MLAPGNAVAALLVLEDGRYLCQLRSSRAGIFYPGHWGLFGGGVEPGEDPQGGLERELREELSLDTPSAEFFTEFTFDFGFRGLGKLWRRFYEVPIASGMLAGLILGEGAEFRAFYARDLLRDERVVPYDAFAIWLHAFSREVA
jgi:8-oxo-dGTP pyrophosphatase MutT (NUDIX family)